MIIPKTQYRLLEKIAEKLGLPIEELVLRSLQEYFLNYIVPVVVQNKH